jgi:2-octaprenyl-6-methoxyphenol hydroxylase
VTQITLEVVGRPRLRTLVGMGSKANTTLRLAVVGAGPVGLALALHAARHLPQAQVSLFDARPVERDVGRDARTLALSWGSVLWLRQLGAWPAAHATPIDAVHVSQRPPSVPGAEVHLRAADLGVPMLGAVLRYGPLVGALQSAWLALAAAEPSRCITRFGRAVAAVKPLANAVEVDAGIAEPFDLAVIAEGGVFGEQARRAVVRDYVQTAWVGTATLEGGTPGLAFERFTRHGPAALLPLSPTADGAPQAALVWCVPRDDDPVQALDDAQRLAVVNTLWPPSAGRIVGLTPLKPFALGLNAEHTLVDGRTVRIGNAAQTLHPVAGQGLNLGLRDAHQLVEALRFTDDVDLALRRVDRVRAPDRWSVIGVTDFLARSFTWTLPGLAALRGLALAGLERTPPLKRRLARQMMFGWR